MNKIDILNCIIATLGFIISISDLIYIVYTNHKKIRIILNNFTFTTVKDENWYMFNLFCNNESKQPIGISSISIISNQKEYNVQITPNKVMTCEEKKNEVVYSRKELYSTCFPINLGSYNSKLLICVIKTSDPLDSNIDFIIDTNRGILKQKISLDNKKLEIKDFDKKLANYCRAQESSSN